VIGVYDSGFGGLTVMRELRRALPGHDFLYLGDSLRAPYGGRDPHVILDLAERCVERLRSEGCRLIVVACHTVSCVALRHLQRRYVRDLAAERILGVTIPAAEAAVARGWRSVGFLGTARTVASGTFAAEVAKLSPARVTAVAASLLAPIVEEGWEGDEIARLAVARYVERLGPVDGIVLGCTHYPLLMQAFREVTALELLDPAPFVAARLADWLARHPGFSTPGAGRLRVLCTGDPAPFARHAPRFLGEPLDEVRSVETGDESGQVVR
jgi:glutamate racemase